MFWEIKSQKVVVFESRLLFRNIVNNYFTETGHSVSFVSGHNLTEEVCLAAQDNALIALGIAGVGTHFKNVLRVIHYVSNLHREVAVWVPEAEGMLLQLMLGLGVSHVLAEEHLADEMPGITPYSQFITPTAQSLARRHEIKRITSSELNVLLDATQGMSVNQIAAYRNRNYKTIIAHRRNMCQKMGLENGADWFELLVKIEKMNAQYL
ncbi:LuxR C-terminal-related transcriptional regulator [Enterobacter quasiroggenkampii]|uniref:LuxR C-terminal-related transcriptional regulator n=1 Tax=Enterobacter quasiroggenkampii TaxID=2497436 RepID=UPI0021CEEBA6|nr:LuxR C-terminal-related transcriptional regulator [Enterobacter quasiroggenkampii]MCU6398424.1 LuxR C-terminal-related transcriptional regulator [Enterobacter quasiroggenkampii]